MKQGNFNLMMHFRGRCAPQMKGLVLDCVGTSLVDLITSSAIMGVAFLGASSVFQNYYKFNSYQQAVHTRNQLLAEIKTYGSSLAVLQRSATMPENQTLNQCLSGISCNTTTEQPLTLYPMVNAGTTADAALTGGTNSPRFYDINGKACPITVTAATTLCPFQVSTSFIPQCGANPPSQLSPSSTCTSPDMIEVVYTITQAAALAQSGGQLQTYTGTIIVQGPN
jgi:hypothetical protein